MTFTQLITEVQKVALKQHNVNSFSSDDVYEYWNRPHTQYASVNIGLESADRTENTIVYNCVLYYGDRLLQNASNKIAIQDDAVKVLQAIISNLPDNITYYTPINYTVFEQEFADYIAGAYCRVRLETEFDQGNCSLDEYIEELKTLYVTDNGIFNVSGYDQVNVNVIKGITEEECRDIIEGYNYATKDEIPSLAGYATEEWVENKGYLTQHQQLKTINNESIVGTGNIDILSYDKLFIVAENTSFTQEDVDRFNAMSDFERLTYVKYTKSKSSHGRPNILYNPINSGKYTGSGMVFMTTAGKEEMILWNGQPQVGQLPQISIMRTLVNKSSFQYDEGSNTLNITI